MEVSANLTVILSIPVVYGDLNIRAAMHIVVEPSVKIVKMITLQLLDKTEQLDYRNGKSSIEVVDTLMSEQFIVFPLTPYDPFFEEFDATLQKLVEAGICPDRVNGQYWKPIANKRYNEEVPPLVLNMDDLGIGFLVCVVPLICSFVVFALELLIPKMKSLTISLKDYLVAVYVVNEVVRIRSTVNRL